MYKFQREASYILESDNLTTDFDEFNEVANAAAGLEGISSIQTREHYCLFSNLILNAVFIDRILDNVVEEVEGL